ncbi:MAG TPA: aminoglycoside phosphotransferase family protein, partial [Roseiflexaceae bacterium]|nr:aminoglycoside phosphotransferase family protein [Roseiflexaceae bacterium]
PWRSYVVSLLRKHGLAVTQAMLHVPTLESTHYMVPLQADALTYTFSHLIPTRRWRRGLVTSALRIPGAVALASNMIPAIGLLAQRRGAAPSCAWMSERLGTTNATTIVASSWRGRMGSVVLYHLDERQHWPTAVAKTTLHNNRPMLHIQEMANLQRIAHTAQVEQAHIPKPVWLGMLGHRPVLVQSSVEGASLAHSLKARPERLSVMLMRIADWLEAWNRATATRARLTRELLHEQVLQPAATVAAYLPEGRAYYGWLEQRTQALLGTTVPMVATHNDLTTSNILVNEQGRLRIVDWETARLRGLPLMDFLYAVVDAVMATGLAGNRVQAFKHCFCSHNSDTEVIRRLHTRLVNELQVPPACVELAFHACWLHHAANEVQQQPARSYQPFVEIVKHISHNPAEWV